MTVIAITSASVGTKLATGTDTHIIGLTLAQPGPTTTDLSTPLSLVDAAAASANPLHTLWSASLIALSFVFGVKPNGPSMAPGLTAPSWPMALITGANIPFTNGVFVTSCPANATFTLTTG